MKYGFILILFGSSPVFAQETPSASVQIKQAQESFNELSDISRNVKDTLDKASKEGDMERVQCISSRQTSIVALVDISKQSQLSIENSIASRNMIKVDSELRKISVALTKARQFSSEIEGCVATQGSKSGGVGNTQITVNSSSVTELLVGDESEFAMATSQNSVQNMDSEVSSSSDSSFSSETLAPPPNTSPYE
jgi:hypothetical protein